MEGDVKPARIPAPLNITQIGGYINLMEQLNLSKLQERTLTSILGLPVQYDETALSKDIEISGLCICSQSHLSPVSPRSPGEYIVHTQLVQGPVNSMKLPQCIG